MNQPCEVRTPTVAAIIPTVGDRLRAHLLAVAVRSAIEQTVPLTEIIVVADGVPQSQLLLGKYANDPRVIVIETGSRVGGGTARNIGVKSSCSELVAFLDDDDEWLPDKLEKQLALFTDSHVVIATKVLAQTADGTHVWPRNQLGDWPHISEFMFCRTRWSQGDGYLQTSSLLTSHALASQVKFTDGLVQHQDWDWLLRVVYEAGAKIRVVDEPLTIWNISGSRPSTSHSGRWHSSYDWAVENRRLFTRRALAGFLLTVTVGLAARDGAYRAVPRLLWASVAYGSPRAKDILIAMSLLVMPDKLKAWARRRDEEER